MSAPPAATDDAAGAGATPPTPAASPGSFAPARAALATAARRIVVELEALECERLAFSPADVRGRVRVAELMAGAGLEVHIDDAGNVLGKLEGRADPGRCDPGRSGQPKANAHRLPPIVAGSHLDTVSNPGRFDGALGVLCALECARFVAESGEPLRHPLVVSALSDEEGTAAGFCWGSRALLGRLSEAERRALADETSPLGSALASAATEFARHGWDVRPSRLRANPEAPLAPAAYLELHIELGPALGPDGPAVAALSAIAGVERSAAVFRGRPGHPATVPLEARADAVLRAAGFIPRYWAEAAALAPRAVVNVGRLETAPGDLNVVPAEVRVFVEQRSPEPSVLERLGARLRELANDAGGEVETLERTAPLNLDPSIRRLTLAAAAEAGIACTEVPSWAGHDAEEFAAVCPAGMIAVRNRGGVSHCPDERADEADIAVGLELLLATLRRVDAAL